ncbi:MAG TPA: hypothetical protein VGI93_06440 [Steroidobacteraceae bacterium]|jgi:hypothetical protein
MQIKPLPILAGLLAISLAICAVGAEGAADSLTKLPLPMAGAPLALFDNPNRLDAVPVCKSSSTMNFYSARSGTVSAAVSWYAAHLSGFKHVHGMGSGRSQDTFYNAGGTLIVSITGEPSAEGQDTKVYSVIYGTIQPGVTDKVIAAMNSQTAACP